jgi:signal peptidase I
MKYILLAIPSLLMIALLTPIFLFSFKGYGFAQATPTGSMYPTIKNYDLVIINWNVPAVINRNLTGEIIVFSKLNICHRCILDEGEWLTTKGDNVNSTEHLTRDEVKGVFIQVSNGPLFEMLKWGWVG